MKTLIIETNEEKTLHLFDPFMSTPGDITADVIGNSGQDPHKMTQDEYDFWDKYCTEVSSALVVLYDMCTALDLDYMTIYDDIDLSDNYSSHADEIRTAIALLDEVRE